MARKKKEVSAEWVEIVKDILEERREDSDTELVGFGTDLPMGNDPDDPIRIILDEEMGDFIETVDIFGVRWFLAVKELS